MAMRCDRFVVFVKYLQDGLTKHTRDIKMMIKMPKSVGDCRKTGTSFRRLVWGAKTCYKKIASIGPVHHMACY